MEAMEDGKGGNGGRERRAWCQKKEGIEVGKGDHGESKRWPLRYGRRALSQEKEGMQSKGGHGGRKRRTYRQKMELRKGDHGGRQRRQWR